METTFYYYDPEDIYKAYLYSLPGYVTKDTFIPDNSTTISPTFKIGYWPGFNLSTNTWDLIEDHRQRTDDKGCIIENTGTAYWLEEDLYDAPARYMKELGPLPAGALLEAPTKSSEIIKQERINELESLLSTIDIKSIRATRSILTGNGSDEDTLIIKELDAQAQVLRTELSSLLKG